MGVPQGRTPGGQPDSVHCDEGDDRRLPAADRNTFIETHIRAVRTFLQNWEARLQLVNLGNEGKSQAGTDIILRKKQSSFNQGFDLLSRQLAEHAQRLTLPERVAEGEVWRRELGRWIEQAPILDRTNKRPRGYPGDSEMMRMIYANDYRGPTPVGRLLHKHSVSTPAGDAVRNRRALVADELSALANSRGPDEPPMTLLSVACGPAHEIADIFTTPAAFGKFRIVLLDQDPEALSEARENIGVVERQYPGHRVDVRYEQASIGSLLRSGPKRNSLGKFDFIYSMGLYDYLDKRTAQKLTNALFDMLQPGGTLLLGNYSTSNPTRTYLEYWCDWWLVYRTPDEFAALLSPDRSCGQSVDVGLDPSGSQLFLRAHKSLSPPASKQSNTSSESDGVGTRSNEGVLAGPQAEGSGRVPSGETMARARL
jgi:2-polyprenyl-3-methyl-5-hydroxy-6-metoxy-1,4-benzoquinol methylase